MRLLPAMDGLPPPAHRLCLGGTGGSDAIDCCPVEAISATGRGVSCHALTRFSEGGLIGDPIIE
jgi:hypothetical protein